MSRLLRLAGLLAAATLSGACAERSTHEAPAPSATRPSDDMSRAPSDPAGAEGAAADADQPVGHQIATLGAGCFWCIEAVLEQIDGVLDVRSGYMGGEVPNPTYEAVCSGRTGHAEVVQVSFDPSVLPYEALLEWFWNLHDPTTLNRQGADVGTQYRSVIFTHSPEQARIAQVSKERKDASGDFADPIVTEISPASEFYVAEDYHQDYYRLNRRAGYCRMVIAPKLDKLGLDK